MHADPKYADVVAELTQRLHRLHAAIKDERYARAPELHDFVL